MGPADFYTGIVAELYGSLKSTNHSWEPYARFITETGEPALELGCGDGEPMLDLRRRGYDVDGIDSSADMLARCARAAAAEELDVALFEQRMEELDLPRKYRSIFQAGPTFTLLPDDEPALHALQGIRRRLSADGVALVPLFIPSPTPDAQLGTPREVIGDDGTAVRSSVLSEERNGPERTLRSVLRYEQQGNDGSIVEDRTWVLHWYTPSGFQELAETAGLSVTGLHYAHGRSLPNDTEACEYTFRLQAARPEA